MKRRIEKAIALAEDRCLWGKTAMANCYGGLNLSTTVPHSAQVKAFLAAVAGKGVKPDGARVFAALYDKACGAAAAALRLPIVVKAAQAGAVAHAWSSEGGGYSLVLRTDPADLMVWLLATLFRDVGKLDDAKALLGAKALQAMHQAG